MTKPSARAIVLWTVRAGMRGAVARRGEIAAGHAPPFHLIRLTGSREIAPYHLVHPDEDR